MAMCDQGAEQKQGYCGLCRVLYQDLDQHLSSLQHLNAVSLSSRGAEASSPHYSSQSAHSLLERFLHDVLKHHPHSYDSSQPESTQHSGQHVETTPTHTSVPAALPQVTWSTWQRTRRQQHRDDFSSEHCSSTIEEVIRRYCYDQDNDHSSDSVHFSLPISIETQTEWEVDLQEGPGQAAVPLAEVETLLQVQMDVEQDYSEQLQWVLEKPEGRGGFLERPIESVLPVPQLIPPSFRGKSWAQIEKEDEARVMKLVQQFKMGVRTCYFDSESLARFGRRGYKTKKTPDLLSLIDHEEEEEEERKQWKRQRKRQCFHLAARCKVVKLSRATQTLYVSSPTVTAAPEGLSSKGLTPEAPLAGATPAGALVPEQLLVTGVFPEKYSSVLTPLQHHTSVLYLLSPPPSHAPQESHQSSSARRRRRPTPLLRSKVTYRRQPLTPLTVKPFSVKPFSVKPRCVRQLFRNLSPEINTGPAPKAAPATTPRREGLRSCRPPRT